jgi:chromosome segregation ATPase
LKERSFVGTASRLDTVFLLLEKMVFGTEEDPEVRKAELLRRRSEIDDELAAVERGEVAVLTGTQTRELYQQVAQTARSLLSDFREVEENLRKLDRAARERIATYDGPKKELLNELMEGQHDISESDQGQTFEAFYRYLMSSTRQDQLAEWLTTAAQLAHPDDRDPRLERVQHDWAEAAERTQSIVRQLSEQLRRFLDNQVWLENRRVMDLIRQIESASIQLRDGGVRLSVGMEIDSPSIKFELPMERPLGSSVRTSVVDSSNVESGDEDFAADSLFNQQYVDTDRLRAAVTSGVATSGHLTLTEVLRHHPLEQGLAEVVTYLALSDDAFDVVFDESAIDAISWTTHDGNVRVAEVPRILYVATDSTTDSRD